MLSAGNKWARIKLIRQLLSYSLLTLTTDRRWKGSGMYDPANNVLIKAIFILIPWKDLILYSLPFNFKRSPSSFM